MYDQFIETEWHNTNINVQEKHCPMNEWITYETLISISTTGLSLSFDFFYLFIGYILLHFYGSLNCIYVTRASCLYIQLFG